MIVDQFVLGAFEDIDKKLELSLQESSLVYQTSNDNAHLKQLQDELWLVKNEVSVLAANLRQRRPHSLPDLKKLEKALCLSQERASPDFVSVSDNVETAVRSSITQYVSVCLYYYIVQSLLDQLPILHDTAQYYSDIHESSRWSLLYALQVLPQRLVHEVQLAKNEVAGVASSHGNSRPSVSSVVHTGFHRLVRQCNKVAMIHNFQFVGIPRDAKKVLYSLWSLPLAAVREEVRVHQNSAETIFNDTARRLGSLMSQFTTARDPESRVAQLEAFFDQQREHSPNCPEKALLDLIPHIETLAPASKIQKPSFLVRYWPTMFCSLAYGPTSAIALWQSRYQILQFCQENIVDFCAGLVQNWIWIPLQQVWSTVRHDETKSSIAVTSKESLNSEFSSLTRMVVDLVAENSNGAIDTSALAAQIESGDLTEFMQIYEHQIHHPVKNILSGKLVRSLLIQIQKTKVDASLALNGIDKLLQSQQLVFGVVAMSPALLIVYCLWTCAYRLSKLGRIWSNMAQVKFKLASSLNNIERLLNYSVHDIDGFDKDLNTGLLALEVVSARQYGDQLMPKNRRGQWIRDVGEIVDTALSNSARLNVVNRIYHVYGRFI